MAIGDGWDLPPGAEPWSDFHWFQPSSRGDLHIVITCDKPVWYTGHFVGGRMCPCIGQGCELCGLGIGSQIRYVFAVCEIQTRRVGLIELGRSNGQLIRDRAERTGLLKGLQMVIRKSGKTAQSRTDIQMMDPLEEKWYLQSSVPDISLALYLTWHKAGMVMPAEFQTRVLEKLTKDSSLDGKMTKTEMFRERVKIIRGGKSTG